eukprot:NODE_1652_length_1424_cov_94.979183_g1568_i0.p1 GENE.NODE_1652_length_1424_cov_94.979183_g1568_i0~~NODE_1652_length_1424_cov_94.979183_g1568_i0.p1  ORF type:complete len:450 (-),score=150.52 NODE_1652_length_1424_cov_94.979183_g1568_i0:73-1272(-)
MGKDNTTEQFLWKNPTGKVPVLETETGFVFESNAIARYLCRLKPSEGLLGRNALEASQVDQWIDFCTNEVEPSALAWVGPLLGFLKFNGEVQKQSMDNIKKAMQALNLHLQRNTFLVGDRLTLADIVLACTLAPLYQRVLEPRLRGPHPCVNRWFETISQQPHFLKHIALAPTSWCVVAQKPKMDVKKQNPKQEVKKEEQKEEPKKEQQSPKKDKKEKAQKPKPAEKEADEEEEEDAPKEEKKPNPMDALPKSSFVLDAYKREYSNSTIEKSMEYLWTNFDPEGYCMYYCTYKYNDECTVLFRTTNLIGGYFQRLERMHKYAFGQMVIIGTEKQHEIQGFWLFRGPELPDLMLDVPDTELYEWKKIDFANVDKEKERIKLILNWETIDGKECLDGKTFK